MGFSMAPSNNDIPLSYSDSIWDIAAQSTNLAQVMLEAGAAPSGSETGEGQYGQNEINEALADPTRTKPASAVQDYVGHKTVSGTVQETELLKVMMEEQELLNRFAEVTNPTGNPKAQGWYTRTGDGTGAIPYVYTLTTDENVVQNEHYYVPVAVGNHSQHDINEALAERFNNYRQYISETLAAELRREIINITLTVSSSGTLSDLNGATVTIREIDSQVLLWTGTWQGQMLTTVLTKGYHYAIEFSSDRVNYGTPSVQRFTVTYGNERNITAEYVYIDDTVDRFFIDDGVDDPATKITGVNGAAYVEGPVSKWIYAHTHRYLVKKIGAAYEMKVAICQLDDTDTTKYALGGSTAALDGTQGDVMTRWPEFWYKVSCVREETTELGAKWEVLLAYSGTPQNLRSGNGWQHWDGNSLLGTYEGCVIGTSLFSRSGVQSTGAVSQSNFKAYARNRGYDQATGDGYTIERWQQHNIHGLLYYARHGHTNSQLKLGYGTDSYQKVTGLTNSLGMQDTKGQGGNGDHGSINNYGVENSHGNKAEWIDNVEVDYADTGNVFTITELDGTTRQVVTQAGTNANVWPTRMVLGDHFDLIATPKNVPRNDSEGYCDGFYLANSSSRVVCVSSNVAYAHGGVAYAYAYSAASNTHASFGARLAFHGEITEYENVNDFKAL